MGLDGLLDRYHHFDLDGQRRLPKPGFLCWYLNDEIANLIISFTIILCSHI